MDLLAAPAFGPQDAFEFHPVPDRELGELDRLVVAAAGLRTYLRLQRLQEGAAAASAADSARRAFSGRRSCAVEDPLQR